MLGRASRWLMQSHRRARQERSISFRHDGRKATDGPTRLPYLMRANEAMLVVSSPAEISASGLTICRSHRQFFFDAPLISSIG